MENTIKKVLANNNIAYTPNQLNHMVDCTKELYNHGIKTITDYLMLLWTNHFVALLNRLETKEELKIEFLDVMLQEIKPENLQSAKEITNKLNSSFEIKVNEAEVFLIATHIENIKNNQ